MEIKSSSPSSEKVRGVGDPGLEFIKDPDPVVDLDPAFRGSRLLCPRALALEGGGYRLYFMEYGSICPVGVQGVIVSAKSADGFFWKREESIRVGAVKPYASVRVLSPDIVRLPDDGYRMYFEGRSEIGLECILSAVSDDGVSWSVEDGVRLIAKSGDMGFGTPCCIRLEDKRGWRLYFHARNNERYEIWSALSMDGIHWTMEEGRRIEQNRPEESYAAYSPYVLPLPMGGWRMYYAGWSSGPNSRGRILAAYSEDGLNWKKEPGVVLEPDDGLDARHCSEPCLLKLNDGRWRLIYEGKGSDGSWRILGATSPQ
jgi:predicted GH43/DUF377 family glycosyl hydrolase